MSPEAQRIAIAEACGWSGFENSGEFLIGVRPQNEVTEKLLGPRTVTNWTPRDDVPDYINDLNAMHEAEKVIPDEQWVDYYDYLLDTTKPRFVLRDTVTATAAQRAEAFLRTLGRWTD